MMKIKKHNIQDHLEVELRFVAPASQEEQLMREEKIVSILVESAIKIVGKKR